MYGLLTNTNQTNWTDVIERMERDFMIFHLLLLLHSFCSKDQWSSQQYVRWKCPGAKVVVCSVPSWLWPLCHTTTVYLDHFDIILDNDYFDKWATSHLRPWNAMPFGTTKGPTTPLLGGWKLKLFTLLSGFRLIVRSLCLFGKKETKKAANSRRRRVHKLFVLNSYWFLRRSYT